MRIRAWLLGPLSLLALGASSELPAASKAARAQQANMLPAKPVADLHYGDVLFQLYSGHEFEALTRLNAYEHWQRMPNHEADAALLAGGLYLQLGMHNEAGERFATLLTPEVPVGVRNRAWFYLARVWYLRGYYPRAEEALGRISGELSPQLEAQRQHLLINALMRQQRFDEAAAKLRAWHGPADWMAYARFNLGVALARQGRLAEADPILTAVGTLNSDADELVALKDKANLALGFAWLQANNPAAARTALDRVRLTGPYATRALLGVGWADAALGEQRAALTPWLELHGRNLLDPAVQESYLAVPYAYGKLGANAQAAEYYEDAIRAFGSESTRIDDAVGRIGSGHLLDDLLGEERTGEPGFGWQLRKLPDTPQSRYLYAVLADNDFQEGLKNYRDLAWFDGTLEHWGDNMEAFGAMIDTRERAYAQRLPETDALLATGRANQLLGVRTQVDAALSAAETGNDVPAFGTPKERDQWARIRALEDALRTAPAGADTDAARDKLRLIKGALYWRLDESFKARDYAARNQLREIDAALNEAQNRWARVQRARGIAPQNTGEFAARIAALSERLRQLRGSMQSTAERQDRYLTHLAQQELLAQKERLAAYEVQARFALADIYDRAVSDGKPAAASGPPAGAAGSEGATTGGSPPAVPVTPGTAAPANGTPTP